MTDRSPIEFFRSDLQRRINAAEEATKKLAEDLIQMGPRYAVRWATAARRAEPQGKLAADILQALDDGVSPADLLARYEAALINEVGYIVPTNSDVEDDVYKVQAIASILTELRWVVKEVENQG